MAASKKKASSSKASKAAGRPRSKKATAGLKKGGGHSTKSSKPNDKRKRKGVARGIAKKPSKRLSAAQRSLRDTVMLTRKIQGWSWEEIAAEAGVKVPAAKTAVEKKKKELPNLLDKDPAEIIEDFVIELQVSIADFEKIASAAMEGANLPVAIGAKARADNARQQLQELLQSVGHLPHDLGTLTWMIDIRAIAVEINGAVEEFVAAVKGLELPDEARKVIDTAADTVTHRLDEIAESPQTVTPATDNEGDPDAG